MPPAVRCHILHLVHLSDSFSSWDGLGKYSLTHAELRQVLVMMHSILETRCALSRAKRLHLSSMAYPHYEV
jgi:hypothetical protein